MFEAFENGVRIFFPYFNLPLYQSEYYWYFYLYSPFYGVRLCLAVAGLFAFAKSQSLVAGNPAFVLSLIRFFSRIMLAVCAVVVLWATQVLLAQSLVARRYWESQLPQLMPDYTETGVLVVLGLLIGVLFWWWLVAKVEPMLSRRYGVQDSDDGLSDVRSNSADKFKPLSFEKALSKIKDDRVFLGLGNDGRIASMPFTEFKKNNFQILGYPGAGKGVFAQSVLTQIMGHCRLVVFDPKEDEYLTSLFADKTVRFINLNRDVPQFDPFSGCSKKEIQNALIEAFSMKEKGRESDVYSLEEQEVILSVVENADNHSFKSMLSECVENHSDARKVLARLRNLARQASCTGTSSLLDILAEQDLYIIFDGSDETQKIIARLLFSRLCQIKKAGQVKAHMTVLCDEFVHLVNKTSVTALGLLRSKGVNFLVAHQSMGDFEAEFADVSSKEARQRTMTNTQIKVIYKQLDDADYWANLTGDKTYNDVMATQEQNESAEALRQASARSTVRQRPLFDKNDFLSLPEQVAVLIGYGVAKKIKTLPPVVRRQDYPLIEESERVQEQPESKGGFEL